MIGKITGRVDYIAEDHALLEAGGVGYVVYCAAPTLARLPAPGEVAALYTELVVREDLMQLIGFRTLAEREWHRLLTSVQGVGARASLAILGTCGPDGVGRALALGDAGAIRAAPGVGPKLAQRIVNELKDKAPTVMALGAAGQRQASASESGAVPAVSSPQQSEGHAAAAADALSALINLGYDRGEAAAAVARAAGDAPEAEAPALIRAALKTLAPAV